MSKDPKFAIFITESGTRKVPMPSDMFDTLSAHMPDKLVGVYDSRVSLKQIEEDTLATTC